MEPTDFFFDVDSTVIARESLQDMVALALQEERDPDTRKRAEVALQGITDAGMNGQIDFRESLTQRLALAPVTQAHEETVTAQMLTEITEGMQEFMQALRQAGHGTWLLTAGMRTMMLPLAEVLGIPQSRVLANEAVWERGRLTGFREGPLLATRGKAEVLNALRAEGQLTGRCIMVGDGASDLATFTLGASDDFYGFGAHAVRENVQKHAPHFFRSVAEMRSFVGL